MHIPDSMLKGAVCPVTASIAVAGLATTMYFAYKAKSKPSSIRFALVTAMIFVLQMLNFPVRYGTSGHFLGTTLAIFSLGIPFGILSMSIVLFIQTLIFADGGISAFGANILNMAFVASIPSMILYKSYVDCRPINKIFLSTVSSWTSVVLASIACSTELALSGFTPVIKVFIDMTAVHSLIGIGEAILTTLLIPFLSSEYKMEGKINLKFLTPFIITMFAILISPFASKFPDGLEWVTQKYNLYKEVAPRFVGLLPDYTFPGIANEYVSTTIAGFLGVGFSLIVAYLVLYLIDKVRLVKSEQKNS